MQLAPAVTMPVSCALPKFAAELYRFSRTGRQRDTHMTVKVTLDHCVVHVSDWPRSNAFYRDVLGAEILERPNGGFVYRFGDKQLNLHGSA
jgi:hypothetical protein